MKLPTCDVCGKGIRKPEAHHATEQHKVAEVRKRMRDRGYARATTAAVLLRKFDPALVEEAPVGFSIGQDEKGNRVQHPSNAPWAPAWAVRAAELFDYRPGTRLHWLAELRKDPAAQVEIAVVHSLSGSGAGRREEIVAEWLVQRYGMGPHKTKAARFVNVNRTSRYSEKSWPTHVMDDS